MAEEDRNPSSGVSRSGDPAQPAPAAGARGGAGGGGGQPPQETITASSAGEVKAVKLDPVSRAGMQLATGVGLLIGLVTVMLVVHWMATAPWTGIPSDLASRKTDDAKALVENIKTMSDLSADRSIKLFDAVVSRALLPVFTAILGYIFGSRSQNR
jgi:hypothetical protein